jgi:hypothetical protein
MEPQSNLFEDLISLNSHIHSAVGYLKRTQQWLDDANTPKRRKVAQPEIPKKDDMRVWVYDKWVYDNLKGWAKLQYLIRVYGEDYVFDKYCFQNVRGDESPKYVRTLVIERSKAFDIMKRFADGTLTVEYVGKPSPEGGIIPKEDMKDAMKRFIFPEFPSSFIGDAEPDEESSDDEPSDDDEESNDEESNEEEDE